MSASEAYSSTDEPLIADPDHDYESVRDESNDDSLQHVRPRTTLRNAGKSIWLLTLSAGLSGLLFGYDTGVVSSALVSLGSDLGNRPLTTSDKSLIASITSLFALAFSPFTGLLADKYGRKSVILLSNFFFILGAVVQSSAESVSVLAAGRALVGAAIGLASCATPLYVTELAPAEIRGTLVTVQALFITGGQVVAYLTGWLLSNSPSGWRWMFALGGCPAVVQQLLFAFLWESPRWLVKIGDLKQAKAVLERLYEGLEEHQRKLAVATVFASIREEIADEGKSDELPTGESAESGAPPKVLVAMKQLMAVPGNRRALIIACTLQGLQQLCGFNSFMYFSATIFAFVGFNSPIATSLSIALTNFVFTVAACAYIDTIGRRRILLWSIPFMTVGLLICSFAFQFIHIASSSQPATSQRPEQGAWPLVLLVSMVVYVAAYAIGLGCVPWQQSELFRLEVRPLGSGIATATNWSSNFVIGSTFLPMIFLVGPSVTFLVYAMICLLGWFTVWFRYPETSGLRLEDVGTLLRDGWGVKKSVEDFQRRRELN